MNDRGRLAIAGRQAQVRHLVTVPASKQLHRMRRLQIRKGPRTKARCSHRLNPSQSAALLKAPLVMCQHPCRLASACKSSSSNETDTFDVQPAS